LFHSASKPFTGYSNTKVDQLIDQARFTVDPAKRVALYANAERAIMDDMPWVFLWHTVSFSVYQPWVRGQAFYQTPRRTVKIWLDK
jgi:ABC-type transport system substrate-binding protein